MSAIKPIANLPASLLFPGECPQQLTAADLHALLESCQALSREIHLDELLKTLMSIALHRTGAAFGMLLLHRGERLSVAARAWQRPGQVEVSLAGPRPRSGNAPLVLLGAALRERRTILLDRARDAGLCAGDAYLRHSAPRSAICIPLLKQGEPIALLFLEHAALAGVFTRPRVAIIESLAAQAAISLEHAQFVQQLRTANAMGRKAEAALRVAHCELARVARITTMGEFAASIAHEVNQPLAAIVLNAGAALNWLKQDPPRLDQVHGALATILRAGTDAGEVIRSINSMARKSGPELAPFTVDDVIREVLLLLRAELEKHDIQVCTDFTPAQNQLHADRAQLQQVLMNLFLNAIDAMAGVSCRARVLEVRSAIADASGTLRISVADTGSGIDAGAAERLFDPLFTTKAGGMGMGLSICRSIVEAHGGRIWSSSRQPHGTAFHVCLPPASAPCAGR